MSTLFKAAVYLRLSKEDGDVADGNKLFSNSISNQKELVMDFLKSHAEIELSEIYTDDGYSGVNFERPEFQRMLSDIREGKVNCVIVKDLSRFGRNYIESGRYIEKIFPMLGIRFIAINDGYDSLRGDVGADMIIPFKNLINDAYCRDISVKVRSHMDIKRRNGDYIGAFAAYGYRKDIDNVNHLVIDDYAADVVRDIFAMKLCGMSVLAIAGKLNAEGVLPPLQYKKSVGVALSDSFQRDLKSKWSYNAVLRILKNEVYKGTVVQGKYTTPNYKIKKRIRKDESEWVRVENMHEAIVSGNEFDLVQELLLRDTRVAPNRSEVFPLAGLVFCADCGEPMVRKTVPSGKNRRVYYVCSGNKKDRNRCSSHMIPEVRLSNAVLSLVKTYVEKVRSLSEAAEVIGSSAECNPKAARFDLRIEKLKGELEVCNSRRRNLYEDFKDGVLSKEEYMMLRERYHEQGGEIEERIARLKGEKTCLAEGSFKLQEWIRKLESFDGIDTLDRSLVTSLISRIDVVDRDSIQVKYRFEVM